MTEDEQIPDSEDVIDDVGEQQEIQKPPARMVPLEALEAERTKRQDLESQNRALQEFMLKSKQPEPEEDDGDDDDFITKAEMTRRLQTATFSQKREILEEAFCQSRPDAVEMINQNLEQIIKTHPWLAQSIESAPNRYERAYQIVNSMTPKENSAPAKKFSQPQADAKRIVENSQKPGNPATITKSSQGSNVDYMKSIQGKPEFREYRRKMLSGG